MYVVKGVLMQKLLNFTWTETLTQCGWEQSIEYKLMTIMITVISLKFKQSILSFDKYFNSGLYIVKLAVL